MRSNCGLGKSDSPQQEHAQLPIEMTGIAVDRFTGGTIDGALYSVAAYVGSAFVATLTVERRGGYPNVADRALLDCLLGDLAGEGLLLGHGTGKGFGWFDVAVQR